MASSFFRLSLTFLLCVCCCFFLHTQQSSISSPSHCLTVFNYTFTFAISSSNVSKQKTAFLVLKKVFFRHFFVCYLFCLWSASILTVRLGHGQSISSTSPLCAVNTRDFRREQVNAGMRRKKMFVCLQRARKTYICARQSRDIVRQTLSSFGLTFD